MLTFSFPVNCVQDQSYTGGRLRAYGKRQNWEVQPSSHSFDNRGSSQVSLLSANAKKRKLKGSLPQREDSQLPISPPVLSGFLVIAI